MIYNDIAPKAPKQSSSAQPSLSDVIAKYSPSSIQAKELNCQITYYLAKDTVPLSTVDNPVFRYMSSKLNPCYQLPL